MRPCLRASLSSQRLAARNWTPRVSRYIRMASTGSHSKGLSNLNAMLQRGRHATNSKSAMEYHVVIGNEACDMDSTVSAIFLSFLRDSQMPETERDTKVFVPVLNIPRSDLSLRTDITYLMKQEGVDTQSLLFADEFPFKEFASAKKLYLSLVDHNRLTGDCAALGDYVEAVLDHHADEGLYGSAKPRIIEMVGSTATLVAEQFFSAGAETLLDATLAKIFLAPILLDTFNFDENAKRGTPKDFDMAQRLHRLCPQVDTKDYYEKLLFERSNVDSLSTMDLLRKDHKEDSIGKWKIGIASVPISIEKFASRGPAAIADTLAMAQQRQLSYILIMHVFSEANALRRELIVVKPPFSPASTFEAFIKYLEASDLKLKGIATPSSLQGNIDIRCYTQENVKASRKQLAPLVQSFFSSPSL